MYAPSLPPLLIPLQLLDAESDRAVSSVCGGSWELTLAARSFNPALAKFATATANSKSLLPTETYRALYSGYDATLGVFAPPMAVPKPRK